jgi:hypothetical protein
LGSGRYGIRNPVLGLVFQKNKLIKSNSGSVLIPKIRPCSRTVLGNLDWNHWLIAGQPLVLVVFFPKILGSGSIHKLE